ncbi:FtsX-like permease family protein [Proteinivorax tanatarense]|uniref:FtsX-like permease family protein n=1 Tax=Proteinivorax tanatarense TaxID=1260629 RepID=A0AAU7VL32_9FIRM
MKCITTLALRYLWQQRKRTALTILGIIISVSMLTSIGILLLSFWESEIERQKETLGAFQAATFVDQKGYEKIISNPQIDKIAYSMFVENGVFDDETVIDLYGYKGDYFYLNSLSLSEGREPQKNDEIALYATVARKLGLTIGDTLEMPVGFVEEDEVEEGVWEQSFEHRDDKQFKVVGLLEDMSLFRGTSKDIAFTSHDYAVQRSNENSFKDVYFTVKDGLIVKDVVEDIQTGLDDQSFRYNDRLLTLQRQPVQEHNIETMASLVAVVVFLVLVVCGATIAVIYNSFNISVLERIRQFGIIGSVGTTPRQIRRIVFVEAGVQTLIAIPLGIVSGIMAMHVVFYLLSISAYSSFSEITIFYSTKVLVACAAIGAFTVFLSALIPAILAGKKKPLEAIFYRPKVKRKKFKRRKGFIVKRFLAAEKALAYKNLQRNKKRSILTAFALSISVILFIVFYVFSYYALNIQDDFGGFEYDFEIQRRHGNPYTEEDYEEIKSLPKIKEVKPVRRQQAIGIVDMDKITDEYKNVPWFSNEDSNIIGGEIFGYTQDQLDSAEEYLLGGKIDKEMLAQDNGVLLIQNKLVYHDNEKIEYQVTDYAVGDKIDLVLDSDEIQLYREEQIELEALEITTLTVMGILEKDPFFNANGLNFITAEDFYVGQVREGYDMFYVNGVEDLDNETHMELSQQLANISYRSEDGRFFDAYNAVRRERQLIIEASVFIYGFIVLISFIGALNIINTISTNLLTRTKEFAMLRAVGMGPKSLVNMIRYEAILSGLIGVIYGCIIGNLLGYWLYKLMSDVRHVPWDFPWTANIIVIVAAIMMSLLASRATVQRVKKMNIIETLREE